MCVCVCVYVFVCVCVVLSVSVAVHKRGAVSRVTDDKVPARCRRGFVVSYYCREFGFLSQDMQATTEVLVAAGVCERDGIHVEPFAKLDQSKLSSTGIH